MSHRRRPAHQKGDAVSTTQVPLFTLFALKASRDFEAPNSNNVKGGTMHAEARSEKKLGSLPVSGDIASMSGLESLGGPDEFSVRMGE